MLTLNTYGISYKTNIVSRSVYVMTLIVSLFDYASIVWGDKNNKVLMNLLQVLHSKVAKLILNQSIWSSSTQALEQLNWLTLSQRRELQQCVYMYNNLLGETLNFTKGIPCLMIYNLYQLSRDLRKQLELLLLNILNRTNLRKP